MTKEQIDRAFRYWRNTYYGHTEIDRRLHPFKMQGVTATSGWLRMAREALLLSTTKVAEKLGLTRAAYSALEQREMEGKVTINSLREAAEALDCELVYALIPKSGKYFSETIWQEIQAKAMEHGWVKSRDQNKKHLALAYVAKNLMEDPAVRKKNGWTNRINVRKKN